MSLDASSLIRRHMKRSPSFVPCEDAANLPVALSLDRDEVLAGWYRNPPPWEDSIVIFTSSALYAAEGERISRTALADIVEYETPKDKTTATGVRLRTKNGIRFLRMAGRYGHEGKFGDEFNLLMILQVLVSRRGPVH